MKTVIVIAGVIVVGVFAYQYGPAILTRFRSRSPTGSQPSTGAPVGK